MTNSVSNSVFVHWCAADAQLIEWQKLEPAPAANRGFIEGQRYTFRHPSEGRSLYIDDEPIHPLTGPSSAWEWQPGFFAGEVTAEVRRPGGGSEGLFLLDVAPDPEKVGQQVFARMVRDLWDEDPTLVFGDEPATAPTGDLGALQDPWLAFARLRRYAPQFLQALAPVCGHPRRTLRIRRDSAPLHQLRRADQQTALSVLRSPAAAMFFAHPDDAPAVPLESRVDVAIVQDSLDAAPNRAILALILAVMRRAQTVLERLQVVVDREDLSETRTPLEKRWPERKKFLKNLTMQLATVVRRYPFVQVSRPEVTAAGLTAVAADPIYSYAWGRGWRAIRYGMESGISTERLWVSPTWEIYERWCFLQLGKLLKFKTLGWQWSVSRDPRKWVGVGPEVQVELLLQPTFGAHSSRREGKWSISRERVPDIVLIVQKAGETRFLVLDAKYRTSRPAVLDAMASAHIYQDSLRIGDRRPEATFLIVPSINNAAWLAGGEFQAEHRVGIFSLSPEITCFLPDLIKNILGLQ